MNGTRNLSPKIVLAGLLLASGVVYALMIPYAYVGCFNDDAMYILAAKSLLQGRYAALELPGNPPANFPLPGYPLFLAPFAAAAAPHWGLLKAVTLGLTLLSAGLLWVFLDSWLIPWLRVSAIVLYLLNPLTILSSTNVMSEPCFLCAILAGFIGLQRSLYGKPPRAWIAAAAIAWASLVRPQGFILIPFILLGAAYERRWKLGISLTGLAAGSWILLLWRNYGATHGVNIYLNRWQAAAPSQSPGVVVSNLGSLLHAMFIDVFLGRLSPSSGQGAVWLVLAGLVLFGFSRLAKENRQRRGLILAACGFLLAYFLGHALWVVIDPHYLLPLLPFALALGVKGLDASLPIKYRRAGTALACAGLLSSYLIRDWSLLSAVYAPSRPPAMVLPRETLEWIEEKLPKDGLLFTNKPKTVFLYTGRQATGPAHFHDPEEFRYWLFKQEIRYFALFPQIYLSDEWTAWWEGLHGWVLASPETFQPIYANDRERTNVLEVRGDEKFMRAWELYLAARRQIEARSFSEASATLERALALAPHLVHGLNAYAATCLILNRNLPLAEKRLEEAVRLRPDFGSAAANLERVRREINRARAKPEI